MPESNLVSQLWRQRRSMESSVKNQPPTIAVRWIALELPQRGTNVFASSAVKADTTAALLFQLMPIHVLIIF